MIDHKIVQNIQNKNNSFDLYNQTQDLITIAISIKKRFETFDDDPLILGNKILIDVPPQFSATLQKTVAPLIQISTEHENQSQEKIEIIFGKYYDQNDVGCGPITTLAIKPMLNRYFQICLTTSGTEYHISQICVPFVKASTKTIELLNDEYQKVMGIKLFA